MSAFRKRERFAISVTPSKARFVHGLRDFSDPGECGNAAAGAKDYQGGEMKYLKKNVAFEPLICRWYAWPFLVSPATFSMVAKNRMIPLLESFIEDPDFHRESVKDPALLGGTFIDFSGDVRLAEDLLDKLQDDLHEQLAFADALVLANDLLIRDGNGGTLENLYEQMPKPLRGAVELGYDLNNNPSLRVFESLLYASSLYKPALQSVFRIIASEGGGQGF